MTLADLCQKHGGHIVGVTHEGRPVEGGRLLWAIAGVESSYGRDRQSVRLEPSYAPGGANYKRSTAGHLRAAWKHWGVLAGCSYGALQILFITAVELGFKGHPIDLQDDDVCVTYATALIVTRFIRAQKATTLVQLFDSYNSGSCRDAFVPADYIAKGLACYARGWDI